ncbi:MAG: BrnA antitoxin family protein [Chloroflexota bacterium]|nr:BrnA antitoxin family protein [Chloroflexota bacterium]
MAQLKSTIDLGYPTEAFGRIPAFDDIEEEAAFWDTHDTADFAEEWTPVQITVGQELKDRVTLRLNEADRNELATRARVKGVGPSTLVRMWLKERLRHEAKSDAESGLVSLVTLWKP